MSANSSSQQLQACDRDPFWGFESLCALAVKVSLNKKGDTCPNPQQQQQSTLAYLRSKLWENGEHVEMLQQSPILAIVLAFQLAIFVTSPHGIREDTQKALDIIRGFQVMVPFFKGHSSNAVLSCWTTSYAVFHLAILSHLTRAMNPQVMETLAEVDGEAITRSFNQVSMMLKSYSHVFRGLEGLLSLYESVISSSPGHRMVSWECFVGDAHADHGNKDATCLQVVENQTTRSIVRLAANLVRMQ